MNIHDESEEILPSKKIPTLPSEFETPMACAMVEVALLDQNVMVDGAGSPRLRSYPGLLAVSFLYYNDCISLNLGHGVVLWVAHVFVFSQSHVLGEV